MKVQILGDTGYLGSFLKARLSEHEDIEIVGLDYVGADHLINCCGLVDIDACEKDPVRSLRDNFSHFAYTCEHIKPRNIIHISSYYAYVNNTTSVNTDIVYSRHKLIADLYTKINHGVVLILGKLFGNGLNQHRFVEHCILNDVIEADSALCPFTDVKLVLKYVMAIISNGIKDKSFQVCSGNMSHYEMARYITDICSVGGKLTLKKVKLIPNRNLFPSYGSFELECAENTLEEDIYDYIESLGYA